MMFAARACVVFNVKYHPQVLSHHYDVLCPPETAEAFRVAETNIETLHAREYDTNSKADKLALGEARWRLERMLVSHHNSLRNDRDTQGYTYFFSIIIYSILLI